MSMKISNFLGYLLLTATLIGAQSVIATKTLAQQVSKDSIVPSQKDAFALMQSICGVGNINSTKGKVSCKTCPSFTGSNTSSGGSLISVIYGSFTKSNVREAFVDFSDCEPHVHNWGGSVLLRKTSKGWSRVRYEQGLRSFQCLKFATSTSRHSLVCKASYTGMGNEHTWLNTVEIGSTKTITTDLLKVVSNTGSCYPPYQEVQIVDFTLQNANKDGKKDLAVRVSEAREAKNTSRSNNKRCEPRLPKPKFHRLTFLSNGQSFRPTTETVRLKKLIENTP
ncbi:hypothetical protein CAL7716_105670 (plasmid) [Calothrix sp. PCC 7716]|nr:hypothetical protein CAL7716_105670 [Calothrix sp. PCC 7716]